VEAALKILEFPGADGDMPESIACDAHLEVLRFLGVTTHVSKTNGPEARRFYRTEKLLGRLRRHGNY